MKKKELKKKFKYAYLNNEPLNEIDVLKNDHEFFLNIVEAYGSWADFKKEIGFLKRHLRERENFYLYCTFLSRYKKFGVEALKHKNIEEEFKVEMRREYKSVKYFTQTLIIERKEESIIYDAHLFFLTNEYPSQMKIKNPELYIRVIEHFRNIENFKAEYQKKFLFDPYEEESQMRREKEEKRKGITSNGLEVNLNNLVEWGYIDKEDLEEIKKEMILKKEKEKETGS